MTEFTIDQIRDQGPFAEDEAKSTYKSTQTDDEWPASIDTVYGTNNQVTITGNTLGDLNLTAGDIVEINNNSAAGNYTVKSIDSDTTFTTEESLVDATGGDVTGYNPTGATKIGVDNRNFSQVVGQTLQAALDWVDNNVLQTSNHDGLNTLTHDLAEDNYVEVQRSGQYVTKEIVWQSSSQNTKIRQREYSYDSRDRLTQAVEKQYDESGNLLTTITRDYTRGSGGDVTSYTDTVT